MKLYVPEDFKEGGIYITVENNKIQEIKNKVTRNKPKVKCEELKKLLIYEGVLSPDQISSYRVEYVYQDGFKITNGQYGNNWYLNEEDEEESEQLSEDMEEERGPENPNRETIRRNYALPRALLDIETYMGNTGTPANDGDNEPQ